MRINPAEKIAGQSPLLIRKLLRYFRGDEWNILHAESVMGISSHAAKKVIKELEARGYITKIPPRKNVKRVWWKNTALGNRFAVAPASKPVTRATAEKRLEELIERVRVVRDNPYYLYRVERVTLFGSILSDKLLLGDVDVAIRLVHKEPDQTKASELDNERRRKASAEGRRFNNNLDYLLWPEHEVILFLKSRSRVLSLCLENEGFLKKCQTRLLQDRCGRSIPLPGEKLSLDCAQAGLYAALRLGASTQRQALA